MENGYWESFKVKTVNVEPIKKQLKALERKLPYGFGRKFGNFEVYVHKKPRVTEIHISVHAPAMMVSLRQSMAEFYEVRKSLEETAQKIGLQVDKIMGENQAWKC